MANLLSFFITIMPYRLLGALILYRRFTQFAQANGLVYFGSLHTNDDHDPVRGFTSHAGQIDNHAIFGTVEGHEVALVQRTVSHAGMPRSQRTRHTHTWLIASVTHSMADSPHALLLSNEHQRLTEEALYVHQNRSEHIALEYRVDAKFLIYARPTEAEELRARFTNQTIELLTSKQEYDYEIDAGRLYVYSQLLKPSEAELTHLLSTAINLANAYNGDNEKSPV